VVRSLLNLEVDVGEGQGDIYHVSVVPSVSQVPCDTNLENLKHLISRRVSNSNGKKKDNDIVLFWFAVVTKIDVENNQE
jgi:hypothetical protein